MTTKQELFDKAYRGLASQGFEKSVYAPEYGLVVCAYRGSENHRCAIGWCISDEDYSRELEGRSCFHTSIRDLFPGTKPEWLQALQGCHDASFSPRDMRERLEVFAKVHGLTVPDITQGEG